MNLTGQVFCNREVIDDKCSDDNWVSIGLKIPKRKDKYVLTRCMNCGAVLPCEIRNLRKQPPKRCVFCSNIGNHSIVKPMTNAWTVYEDCAICNVLTNGKIVSFYIDRENYAEASKYVWRVAKKKQKYYVVTGSYKKGTAKYLHDFVVQNKPKGMEVDHIDGNSLNNRAANLRIVSRQENIDNQRATRIDNEIGIRGIVYLKAQRKYKVDFYYHKKRYYTKYWDTIEEAVWCRYCFEEHFNLNAIRNNPLATKYYTLDNSKKKEIQMYVLRKILGNER